MVSQLKNAALEFAETKAARIYDDYPGANDGEVACVQIAKSALIYELIAAYEVGVRRGYEFAKSGQ